MSVSNCPYGYRRSRERILENGCHNANACPVCARKIQAKAREGFVLDATSIESHGYLPWHITLTLSYGEVPPWGRYQFLLREVWAKFRKTKAFKSIVDSPASAGYMRIVEETISISAQLNPHIHLVLFWKGPECQIWKLPEAWSEVVSEHPGQNALMAAQSVEQVYDIKGFSWYLFKHMYIDLRKEVPFASQNLSPVECLRMFHATKSQDWLALWFIFETSSVGVKRIVNRLRPIS
jgi:hypothetical protein